MTEESLMTYPGPAPQNQIHGNTSGIYMQPPPPPPPPSPPMEKHTSFLEGWKFFVAIGATITVPITVTVWLLSYHERRPHESSVPFREYSEFRDEMKDDVKEIKRSQTDIALEISKQSRAIIEFVNLQEKSKSRRNP